MEKVKILGNKLVILPEKGEDWEATYAYKAIAELLLPFVPLTEKTEIISQLLKLKTTPYLLAVIPKDGEIKKLLFQYKKEVRAVAVVDPKYTLPYDTEFITEFIELAGVKAFLHLLTTLKYQNVYGKFISGPYSKNYYKYSP